MAETDTKIKKGKIEIDPETGFDKPVTGLREQRGRSVVSSTRVEEEKSDEIPPLFVTLTKQLGLKTGNLLSYNRRTRVAVYDNGGKYQVSKNGKSLRHLAGPQPPADLDLPVVEGALRGYVGAAAEQNVPATVPEDDEASLTARKEALEAELAAVNEQLEE